MASLVDSLGFSSIAKYPHPSDVNMGDFVSIKLSPNNYFMWRLLVLDFLESQDLVGFINGTIQAPPEKITVPDDSSSSINGTKEIENQDYQAWKKLDWQLRGWILSTINEDILVHVVRLKTAKDVWESLQKGLSTMPFDPTENVLPERGVKNLCHYLPLHKAAVKGDWEMAREFLEQEPDAVRAVITAVSETALMVAARSTRRNHFVKKLVDLMSPEDLAVVDVSGLTVLHMVASVGNFEVAKLLVRKNPNLPNFWDSMKFLPIHKAALYGRREMVLYLLTVTKDDVEPKPFEDESGLMLVHALISIGLYDIALLLLKRYPNLAIGDPSPLLPTTLNHSAFPSGTSFNFWQRLIYSRVPIKLENFVDHNNGGSVKKLTNSVNSVRQKFSEVFWGVTEILVPQIKDIREKKSIHLQLLQLVRWLCMEIVKLDHSKSLLLLGQPLKIATSIGIREIVEEIVGSFPSVVYLRSEKDQTLFHLAVVNRRENVFNLLYQFEGCRQVPLSLPDITLNNGLHLAGCLAPQQKLELRASAAGAALQMQREIQWFKEVEKFTLPQNKEQGNSEGKTPRMVFTETHKELVKQGEQWMKDMANSCTIVATLITTVVFAAAITVPGGNNSNSGLPIFSKEKPFVVFAISDALALFLSTSSTLMFLSILTSRYAEDDFLYALPRRLIIGLVTLFLSIISMMVAFSATLYLVFGDTIEWILIAVIALACLPVTLFVFLQFPLLLDMIKSTYWPGIFGKQSDRILF